jgi:hypothetical protein
MLWTDAFFVNTSDLVSLDPSVVEEAQAQGVLVEGQNSIIHRSLEEAGRTVMGWMSNWAGFLAGDSLSANHLQAVFNIGTPAVQRSRVLLDNLVINGVNANYWSELKAWVAYLCLVNVYRAASNRAQDDRYEEKRKQFRQEQQFRIEPQLRLAGLPVVYKPMAAPGAVMAHNSGSWVAGQTTGTGTTGGSFDVAITYLDNTQSVNNESHPSAVQTVEVTAGNVVSADITNLVPPTGRGSVEDIARAIITPLTATHWNIFVGPVSGTLRKQNTSPIPIAQKVFTLTGDPTTTGSPVGQGQYVNQYLTIPNLVFRG